MPGVVHEFTRDQLALALGESRYQADALLATAWHLATRLGGTLGALTGGTLSRPKAEIIVRATAALEPAEAGAAEVEVLDRAGRLTPGGLRSAAARAVMEVAPAACGVRTYGLGPVAPGPRAERPWPARCGFSPRRS